MLKRINILDSKPVLDITMVERDPGLKTLNPQTIATLD